MIASWKLDLNRILRIFNVRSIDCTWLSLIVPFQTELTTNTHVEVPDLHCNVLTGQEGTDNQRPWVGAPLSTDNRTLTIPRLKPGQRSRIVRGPQSHFCTAFLLENSLRRGRGFVSDVTS